MNRRVNIRLLFRAGGLLLALGVVTHIVHAVQVGRQARVYRDRGEAVADEDLARSALYLGRYLQLRPGDLEVEGRYGLVLARLAATPAARLNAYHLLEKTLRQDPKNVAIRQALGGLSVRLGRFDDAARHLEPLRRADVDQAELEETLAWCHVGAGDQNQAERCLRNAIALAPDRVGAYEHLSSLLLGAGRRADAGQLLDEMVKANPRLASAFVARARFREKQGQLSQAAADLSRGVTLDTADSSVLHDAAAYYRRQGRPDQARPILERAVRTRKDNVQPVLALVRLEQDGGHDAEAVAVLRRAVREQDDQPQFLTLLGECLLAQGPGEEPARLATRLPADSPWAAYLDGARLLYSNQYVQAARRLEPLAGALGSYPAWPEHLQLLLARCYAACGDFARQREACQRALHFDPAGRTARMMLAQALTAEGRYGDACKEWARLMRGTGTPPGGWVGWGRALARNNLLPGETPDWPEVERLFTQGEQAGADPAEVAIARAESLALQNQLARAARLLLDAATRLRHLESLRLAIADLRAAQGRFAEALSTLGDRDSLPARLARIRYVQHGGNKVAEPAKVLARAMSGLERLPADHAAAVLKARAELERARAGGQAALVQSEAWCVRAPHDLKAQQVRLALSVREHTAPGLRDVVTGLRHIEGESGLRWRCAEVVRLLGELRQAPGNADANLARCRQLLDDARRQGGWTSAGAERVTMLQGQLEEIVGRADAAVELYRQAFEQGERDEAGTYRLAWMLMARQRLSEADRILRVYELGDRVEEARQPGPLSLSLFPLPPPRSARGLPPSLARLGCEIALHQRDHTRALELAERAVPPGVGSYLDQLWLAEVYQKTGWTSEATQLLERLVERSPDVAEVWVALVRQLVQSGARDRAEDLLPRAQRHLAATEDLWQLSLAQCQEAIGWVDQAERGYRLALKAHPHNPLVLRQAARFYLVTDQPEKALPPLRSLASSPYGAREDAARARRLLAGIPFHLRALKRQPPPAFQSLLQEEELRSLLKQNQSANTEQVAARRAGALLTAAQARGLKEGLQAFRETVTPEYPLTPEDQFRLAQMCELAGEKKRSAALMEELLTLHPYSAQFLAGQVRSLLGQGERRAARPWLLRLQEVEPDSPRVRELRAQLDG